MTFKISTVPDCARKMPRDYRPKEGDRVILLRDAEHKTTVACALEKAKWVWIRFQATELVPLSPRGEDVLAQVAQRAFRERRRRA